MYKFSSFIASPRAGIGYSYQGCRKTDIKGHFARKTAALSRHIDNVTVLPRASRGICGRPF
ncbi:uncharacterized protein CIMG_13609 [Coccidioides immitis RS]|uniref:Uncharacterized protein n=1 Tax=Coccidioides immitis (strain RS) TaxID=246410 RepID=A0A0D8JVL8_COCIM|nr:uncharacterized protein CIMG_13609 [Coccidioides immitis RS]KJF61375.1 hypothetical protein CIMG_13609 [Coccidioides immitis RS]